MEKKRKRKSKFIKILEYVAVCLIIFFSRFLPLKAVKIISNFLGDMLYFLVPRRRNIAIKNLQNAFKREKDGKEIRRIARQSCRSFSLAFLEIIKLRSMFIKSGSINKLRAKIESLEEFSHKARKIHDEAGGCIFVTPHLGSWELLPYLFSAIRIPLALVVRPLDNTYLEKLIYANRAASGQVIIPKKNALPVLRKTLCQGKSIGMLPDQSTMKGIYINFFGHKATATPVPAILAINYKRPIVVVACCRKSDNNKYESLICKPLWPGEYKSKKAEIFRLTEEMNHMMESTIRKYPEQYLWIHNRWKTYKGIKQMLA